MWHGQVQGLKVLSTWAPPTSSQWRKAFIKASYWALNPANRKNWTLGQLTGIFHNTQRYNKVSKLMLIFGWISKVTTVPIALALRFYKSKILKYQFHPSALFISFQVLLVTCKAIYSWTISSITWLSENFVSWRRTCVEVSSPLNYLFFFFLEK